MRSFATRFHVSWSYAAMLVAVVLPSSPVVASPVFSGLGSLGGSFIESQAYGISADGAAVVGRSIDASVNAYRAVRWDSGAIGQLFGLEAGGQTQGLAVSGDGAIAVGSGSESGEIRAVAWAGLSPSRLATLSDSANDQARGASYDGSTTVGIAQLPQGGNSRHAARWTASGVTDLLSLGGISEANGVSDDGNIIVGWSESAIGNQAFRWESGVMTGLGFVDGFNGSQAYAVSADGSVVVGELFGGRPGEAFRWEDGSMVSIGRLPDGQSPVRALAVSESGDVIVGTDQADAFIWTSSSGMRRLSDVLANDLGLDLSGWTLIYATDISHDGKTIVGWGTNPSGLTEAWIAVIPEPPTALLLGSGLMGLGMTRRARCCVRP